MRTYVINLERSVQRKSYMEQVLSKASGISYEFVKAADGSALSEGEISKLFDRNKFYQRYGRHPRLGEIGCTLSHQYCYRQMLKDAISMSLILEDDIQIHDYDRFDETIAKLESFLSTESEPMVILLSSWFWYTGIYSVSESLRLSKVYDAFFTYAYMLNAQAAKMLIENAPFITADDWRYIRKKGIKVYALIPHLVDHNEVFESNIRDQMDKSPYWWRLCHFPHLLCKKLLEWSGHFEKP